jgi:hypothetical protein
VIIDEEDYDETHLATMGCSVEAVVMSGVPLTTCLVVKMMNSSKIQ